jgi:NAD-dependent deacetylase
MQFSAKLMERLKVAYHVAVLTGAGMSAASGVPTFRGKDGLWNKFKPQELASVDAFLDNPELVWEWYRWRRELIKNVKPNAGHFALVDMAAYFPEFSVITQNVDNLHQIAGTKKIVELHGNIMQDKCIHCTYKSEERIEEMPAEIIKEKTPRCPQCNSLLRPAVVWFGELLPRKAIETAQALSAEAEVFFSVGTSSTVEPAASLPYLAKGNGAYLVEINPEETPLSFSANERFKAGAHEVLPELVKLIKNIRQKIR